MAARNDVPSFIKLLNKFDSLKKIQIPNGIVEAYPKKLQKRCQLEGVGVDWRKKGSWDVRIRRKDGAWFICLEDWSAFAEENNVIVGDCLGFWLVDESTFKVVHYGQDGRWKPYESPEESSEDSYDPDSEETDQESDEEEETDDDYQPEENEEEETDNAYEPEEIEEEREKTLRQGVTEPPQHGHPTGDGNDRGFPDVDSFYFTVRQYHMTFMIIPPKFAAINNLMSKKTMMLQGVDGQSWPVNVFHRSYGRTDITIGWSRFIRAQGLKVGDICKFTLVGRAKNILRLDIL